MGVHCRTLGHAYDSTEFEQDREERAEGTVLVCREFRVCSRCGHREELYHNERLIDPDPPADSESAMSDPRPSADGSTTSATSTAEAGASVAQPTAGADRSEPAPDVPGDGELGETASSDPPEDATTDEPEPTAAPTEEAPPDGPSSEPAADGPGREDDQRGAKADEVDRPLSSDSAEVDSTDPVNTSSSADQADSPDPDGDDAVILTETASRATDGGSTVTRPSEDAWRNGHLSAGSTPDELGCRACETAWVPAETPLREGDLCPVCHTAYLERR